MLKPRIKPGLHPVPLRNGEIRLGSKAIADPDGSVRTLLAVTDGRPAADIIAAVTKAHPHKTPESVRAALGRLIDAGFVEDAGGPVPPVLTPELQRRYASCCDYWMALDRQPRESRWMPQARLLEASVACAGVGGAGSVAALTLTAAGVGHLDLIDPDVVEERNLARQLLYSESDIGALKAEAAANRLRQLNRHTKITATPARIGSAADLMQVARRCDVLLLTADRPWRDLRIWANRACLATGRAWVDAGYRGARVQAAAYRPGAGPCWECVQATSQERQAQQGILPAGPEDRPAATAAPSTALSGSLAAHLVTGLITGAPAVTPGAVQSIILADLTRTVVFAPAARPGCPACGTRT